MKKNLLIKRKEKEIMKEKLILKKKEKKEQSSPVFMNYWQGVKVVRTDEGRDKYNYKRIIRTNTFRIEREIEIELLAN